jgi:hypothetical protein
VCRLLDTYNNLLPSLTSPVLAAGRDAILDTVTTMKTPSAIHKYLTDADRQAAAVASFAGGIQDGMASYTATPAAADLGRRYAEAKVNADEWEVQRKRWSTLVATCQGALGMLHPFSLSIHPSIRIHMCAFSHA